MVKVGIGESSELIRAGAQATQNTQHKRFSNNGSTDIVCNADMRVGEAEQFFKLQTEVQNLT
jgi:hypothetical protein